MTLHRETFNDLRPTTTQMHDMEAAREAACEYAHAINLIMPDGPDKTYVLRQLREIAMWVNVGITRHADGAPRTGGEMPEYPSDHPAPGDLGSTPL
jgi:hypothetical protein